MSENYTTKKVDGVEGVFSLLKTLPMPTYNRDYYPSEIEYQMIRKKMESYDVNDLSEEQQHWLFERLMPSLVRFGTYPPPGEQR